MSIFEEVFSAMADRAMKARKLVAAAPVQHSDSARILAAMGATPQTIAELMARSGISKQRIGTYIKNNPGLFVISYRKPRRGKRAMEARVR